MTDLIKINIWIFAGLAVIAFVYGFVRAARGSSELWTLLSGEFGTSTSIWPDDYPNESINCSIAALDDQVSGWMFVKPNGIFFRLGTRKTKNNALLIPWASAKDFQIEADAESARFSIDRKLGLPVGIRISWDQKLSGLAEKYRAGLAE